MPADNEIYNLRISYLGHATKNGAHPPDSPVG